MSLFRYLNKLHKDTVAIIPARKGSKGVPFKNKRLLAGRPLIEYTIEAALNSNEVDLFLSSDDEDIIRIAESYGLSIEYVRPVSISLDTTSMEEVVFDALTYLQNKPNEPYKYAMILQPTSPFRTSKDIQNAINLKREDNNNILGVSLMIHHPSECIIENLKGQNWSYLIEPANVKRRQDYVGSYWFINGAMYCFDVQNFLDNKAFNWKGAKLLKMSEENSLDIDTNLDFIMADALMKSILNMKIFD